MNKKDEQGRREPICFCFCGPTASGKTTISREVLKRGSALKLSISTTTRAPRGEEADARDYFFVSEAEFNSRVESGRFVEHAVFNGKRYGTEKRNMEAAADEACDLILDIEVQGVKQMKALYGSQVVTVFVFPPSMQALEERLRGRGTEDEAKIQSRLKIAHEEIQVLSAPGFSDYLVVNVDLKKSIKQGLDLVSAERCRFSRFPETVLQKLLR